LNFKYEKVLLEDLEKVELFNLLDEEFIKMNIDERGDWKV
jgi:hypothetical protein